MRKLLACFVLALPGFGSNATAATPQEIAGCQSGPSVEKRLAICERIANNPKETTEKRIWAFSQMSYGLTDTNKREEALAKMIDLDPKRLNSYTHRAWLRSINDNLSGAISDYTTALEIQESGWLHLARGRLYRQAGDPDRAQRDFEKAIQLLSDQLREHPEQYFNHLVRWEAHAEAGNVDQALADHAEYLKRKKPEDDPRIIDRADLLFRKGDMVGAIADYSALIKADPTDQQSYFRRALAYRMSGDTAAAIRDYDSLLGEDFENVEALLHRGLAYAAAGNPQRAIVDFTRTIDLFPEGAAAYYNRGQAHRDAGNLDLAVSDYTAAIERDPNMAVAYNSRGHAYIARRQHELARADLDTAIRLAPRLAAAHANRGAMHQSEGKLEEALVDFGHAIEIDPANIDFRLLRAMAFGENGANDQAEADLTAALIANPVNAQAYVARAIARYRQGHLHRALADTDRALVIDKTLATTYRVRADIDAALGLTEKAIADLDAFDKVQSMHLAARRALFAPEKAMAVRIIIRGDFPKSPASLPGKGLLRTVIEVRGDTITYAVDGEPTYQLLSGEPLEQRFPGVCSGQTTTNMGDRKISASVEQSLVRIELRSYVEFSSGACRGRFNDYKENFVVDISNGGCKFSYQQLRGVLGNSEFGFNVLDQHCRTEPIN